MMDPRSVGKRAAGTTRKGGGRALERTREKTARSYVGVGRLPSRWKRALLVCIGVAFGVAGTKRMSIAGSCSRQWNRAAKGEGAQATVERGMQEGSGFACIGKGGGYRGVRVGEASSPGPYTEGGASSSGVPGTDRGASASASAGFDQADAMDPFMVLEAELVEREVEEVPWQGDGAGWGWHAQVEPDLDYTLRGEELLEDGGYFLVGLASLREEV